MLDGRTRKLKKRRVASAPLTPRNFFLEIEEEKEEEEKGEEKYSERLNATEGLEKRRLVSSVGQPTAGKRKLRKSAEKRPKTGRDLAIYVPATPAFRSSRKEKNEIARQKSGADQEGRRGDG